MDRRIFLGLLLCWLAVTLLFFFIVPMQRDMAFFGAPLDDSWIHFSFARNLALHGVFGLNSAELSNGSTSPLWVCLLAFFYKLTHQMAPVALALSAVFVFLTSLTIYKLTLLFIEDTRPAFFAAVITLLTGRFLWGGFSGMEVSLFAFLMAAGIYHHEKAILAGRISFFESFLFGLASLARPEGHLLFAFAFLDIFLRNIRSFREKKGRLMGYLGIYLFLNLPYSVFSYALTGRPFCSSYYSKISFFSKLNPLKYLKEYFRVIFLDNPPLSVLAFFGLCQLFKKRKYLLISWLLGFPLVASFKAPIIIHYIRYNMPLIPLYISAGFVGLHLFKKKGFMLIYLAFIISFSLLWLFAWAERFSFDAASIENQHFRIAAWLNKNVPEGEAVATNDIGAISYFSGRRVVDLCGIVNPDILNIMMASIPEERRRPLIYDYLAKKNVRYLTIYPNWFLWFQEDDRMKKVFEVRIANNTIAASDTMEVYKFQ